MSIYKILPVNTGEEKMEGATILDVSKLSSASVQKDSMRVDNSATPIRWVTGLEEGDILYSKVLTDEEKEITLKQLEIDLPIIKKKFGPKTIESTNKVFWEESGIANLEISPSIQNVAFDTSKNINYLLRKYAILAGSYDLIAPSEVMARKYNMPYYMSSLEEQETKTAQPVNLKLKAFSELNAFLEKSSEMQIRWFCWALDKSTQGYSSIVTKSVMSEQLVEFLEGKKTKGVAKRDVVSKLLEKLETWKVRKDSVIIEAIFNAALHYGHIYKENGFYFTTDRRTKLHATVEDSIALLGDPTMVDEATELQDAIKTEFQK